jgi:NADH:ubiquinone oxidoreductase subunit 3 (subunit A)
MPGKYEGASAAIDIATKIIVTLAIPVATFFINQQINLQTQVIKDQSAAFEKGIKLRDMDVELTVKFYDIQILRHPGTEAFRLL